MANNKHVVLCLPTGSGKSVIFSELVRLAAHKGSQCLVLTHRIELFTSNFRHIERRGIVPHVIKSGSSKDIPPDTLVTVAMVETLSRRINKGLSLSPDIIIIDEAHFGNFTKLITQFPDAFIVGVTATPVGKHFHKHYTDIVANIDIPELVDKEFLVPCVAYQMEDDFSDVTINSMGEYDNESLYKHFNKSELYSGVIREYENRLVGKKTLVFNVNIKHTHEMTDAFNAAGYTSHAVTSKTPMKEREKILDAFNRGEFMVLNNCGVLTTGYDEPSIDAIIMNRATLSLPLWLQCQGRGSRIHPGKPNFTVIDFGKNHDRHGLWQEPRTWSLDPPKKKKKLAAAPVRTCPQCAYVMPASSLVCPGCGYEFQKSTEEIKDGVARLVTLGSYIGKRLSELTIEELVDLSGTKIFKPTYIWRVVRSHGEEAVQEYAQLKSYKPYWAKQQLLKLNDCEFYDKKIKR